MQAAQEDEYLIPKNNTSSRVYKNIREAKL